MPTDVSRNAPPYALDQVQAKPHPPEPEPHPNPRNTSTRGQSQSLNRTPRATPNYCGLQGHGQQERTAHRPIHCPAYGTTCSSCGRQNHTAQMCWQSVEHERAIFEQVNTMVEGTLHHQTWDPTSQLWTQRKSPPQPHIDVSLSALAEDFRYHGQTLRTETHNLVTTAMADTGCQSCLAGPGLLSRLRLTASDLIPVHLIMHSASGTNMPIMGAAIIRIRVNPTGPETRQMVYFSEIANKLYLSLATCPDLGLISKDFPRSTPMSPSGNSKARGPTWEPRPHKVDLISADLQARPPDQRHQATLQTRTPPPIVLPTQTPRVSQSGRDTIATFPKTCSCPDPPASHSQPQRPMGVGLSSTYGTCMQPVLSMSASTNPYP